MNTLNNNNQKGETMKKKLIIHDITENGFIDIFGYETKNEDLSENPVINPGIDTTRAIKCTGGIENDLSGLWSFENKEDQILFLKELKHHFDLESDGCHNLKPYFEII